MIYNGRLLQSGKFNLTFGFRFNALQRPNGVAVTRDKIYISDSGYIENGTMQIFEIEKQTLQVKSFATITQGRPDGIKLYGDNLLLVSMGEGVQVYDLKSRKVIFLIPVTNGTSNFIVADNKIYILAENRILVSEIDPIYQLKQTLN